MKGFFLKWREVFNEHKVLFFVDLFFIIGVLVVAVSATRRFIFPTRCRLSS